MDPCKLLAETQRAAGFGLLEQHESLITRQNDSSILKQKLVRQENSLKALKDKNSRIEKDVDRLKNKDKIEKDILIANTKIIIAKVIYS
jgi:hypothetical protein